MMSSDHACVKWLKLVNKSPRTRAISVNSALYRYLLSTPPHLFSTPDFYTDTSYDEDSHDCHVDPCSRHGQINNDITIEG